jgi:TolB protein
MRTFATLPAFVVGAVLLTLPTGASATEPSLGGFPITVKAGDKSLAIALPGTLAEGDTNSQADAVWRTVQRDLEMTGYFRIVDPMSYFEADGAGIEPGTFDFSTWQRIRASALAKTKVRAVAGQLQADVYLYDVSLGSKIVGKRLSAGPNDARALGHQIATVILEQFGLTPLFDSEIVAVRGSGDSKEIVIVGLDGQGSRAVTRNGTIDLSPTFHPNGHAVAWTSFARGKQDLVVKDLGTGAVRTLSGTPGMNAGAAYSPDGRQLALARSEDGDTDIYVLDATTGATLRRITTGGGIDVDPTFSSDGSLIAFGSERSGGSHIFVAPAGGGEARRVTFQGAWNYQPAFSPDGRKIAFVGRDGNHDIFVVGVDGQGLMRITQGQGNNESPSWSPDGKYLLFTSTRSGSSEIWLSTADGRHQVQVTEGGGWSQPSFRP